MESKREKKHSLAAEVVSNEHLCGGWLKMEIRCPEIAAPALPGQFVQVKAWEGTEPLLRRPFSIAGSDGKQNFSLLLKVLGPGTRKMAALGPGSGIEVVGPLGLGFPKPEMSRQVWMVAGGTGVAPFLFMLKKWKTDELRLFYGARSAADCGAVDLLPRDCVLTTEAGDKGIMGLVTETLGVELADSGRQPDRIYACGPPAMLIHVHELAVESSVPCFVSLEAHMGCGFGACLGCAVPASNGKYFHVCEDGPVFDSRDIDWSRLCSDVQAVDCND